MKLSFIRQHRLLYLFIAVTFFGLSSCYNDDDQAQPPITEPLPNEISEFVWEGLNSWYLWQPQVSDLADSKNDILNDYYKFLNSFSDPEQLFYALLNDYGEKPNCTDCFSWFVDDYVALENAFQGISTSFGYEFGFVNMGDDFNYFAFVKYVLPNSPAEQAGLKRGDLIRQIDGIDITKNNAFNLFYERPSYTLHLADLNGTTLTLNGNTIAMTSVTLTENPVFHKDVITSTTGKKVGYLVYNGFTHTFHSELNAAFGEFKAANVDEFVLDLRYNPGGSVETSLYLASMIDGNHTGQQFGKLAFSPKKSSNDLKLDFTDKVIIRDGDFKNIGEETINSLGMTKLYVLISGNTASASELIINGLDPYIDIKLVGTTTTGKNVGSRTLYDSPGSDYLDKDTANPNHKSAMQPLIFRLANANDFSDYTNGFDPDKSISEGTYLADGLKPLGDVEEPLLKAALDDIDGISTIDIIAQPTPFKEEILPSLQPKHDLGMYLNGIPME